MLDILISFLTFVLILTSLFMVLVILMQRANTNAGMGSAFGGGVTESAFGAETTNILTRATKWSAVLFFVLSLVLYLLYMSQVGKPAGGTEADLPDIPSPAEAMPPPESIATEAADAMETTLPEAEAAAEDSVPETETTTPAP